MCVEKESVLQLPSNPLFTPVPVMDGRFPLKNCVLSVSQFTGAERESLVELAKYLGAEYVYLHVLLSSYTPSGSALCNYPFFPHLFCPLSTSLTQGPGLLCALGQSKERHAGQHPSGVAKPRRHQVPGCKEMGPSSCHHKMDIGVCSNRPEGNGGAFSN